MPGAMALGAGGSSPDARAAARVIGAELAAAGINQDSAPVADVNVNPANPRTAVPRLNRPYIWRSARGQITWLPSAE